eukprot:Skav204429  [mRNA]  locus=scaffold3703:121405:127249:+ [translate_table: standard]
MDVSNHASLRLALRKDSAAWANDFMGLKRFGPRKSVVIAVALRSWRGAPHFLGDSEVMSLLAASRRVPRQVASLRIARRCLGDSVSGPQSFDIQANLKHAMNFFTKPAMSYGEFKQQCVSLRLFAFVGVCGYCVLSLMWCPPKSSYWIRYSPTYGFCYVRDSIMGSSPPLFLSEKVERDTDVPTVAQELITTRRLLSGGSDSEEEH